MYYYFFLLGLTDSYDIFGFIDENANGYIMDLSRCSQFYLQQMIPYMDNIKTGVIPATSSKNEDKCLKSTKLVILACFVPNMSMLCLARWSFYHTTIGTVYFNCQPTRDGKTYTMTLAKENECAVNDKSLTEAERLNDDILLFDYVFLSISDE